MINGNKELPLTVLKGDSKDAYLCEGILKPAIANVVHNKTFIGASGGNFTNSPEQLKRILKAVAKDGKVYFCPDAGFNLNPQVQRRDRATVELIQSLGYEVYILDWGQLAVKTAGDVDEISSEVLESAIAIPASDFLAFPDPDFGEEEWTEPDQEAYQQHERELEEEEEVAEAEKEREREQWRNNYPIAAKNRYNKLKQYTPDTTINKRFLTSDDYPQKEGLIVSIASGLGTNKTGAMGDVVKALPDDEGWLAIGHRNNLLIQSSNRWEFSHLKTLEKNNISINKYITDNTSKITCCFDSLIKFNPEHFDGRNLILDETTAGILHLLTSGTDVKHHLQECCDLFQEALQRAKRVYCLDGLMTDAVIDYLHKLAPNKEVVKIQNDYVNPVTFHHYIGTQEIKENEPYLNKRNRSPLVDLMSYSQCPFVVSDSQLFCAAAEKMLSAELGPNGIRVDGTTVAEPHVQEFMRDPDTYIREHNLQWAIGSPSMECGVDVSIRGYFSDYFEFFFGAIGTDAMHQFSFRLRDEDVSPWFWCNEFDTKSETLRSPFPKTNLRNHEQFLMMDIQNAFTNGEDITGMLKEICQMRQENPHSDMWAKLEAIHNYERGNLRECLVESLESKGHTVIPFSEWDEAQFKREKEAKEEVKDEYSAAIFNAEDIDKSEIEERKKRGKFEDQCAVRKKVIKMRLPEIENTPHWNQELIRLLEFDDRDRILHLQRYWLLLNMDAAQRLQQIRWEKLANGYISKYHMRSDFTKIKALREAGIDQFLNSGDREWKADDPEVMEFFNNCKKKEFRVAFGKSPSNKSHPLNWLHTCLAFFGFESKKSRKRINGVRVYTHRTVPLLAVDDRNPDLFECINLYFAELLEKDKERDMKAKKEKSEKMAEIPTVTELNPVPPLPACLNKTVRGGQHQNTEKNNMDEKENPEPNTEKKDRHNVTDSLGEKIVGSIQNLDSESEHQENPNKSIKSPPQRKVVEDDAPSIEVKTTPSANNHDKQVGRCWWHKEGMKPYGTENDLPISKLEGLVEDYLTQHGETEEFELIAAIGQKTPVIRAALDNIGAKRRRVNGRSSIDYTIYWSFAKMNRDARRAVASRHRAS